jgi:hypothetical protein
VQRRHEIFRRLEVERLVYASFVLRRHETLRAPYTARRLAGPRTGTREVEWLDRWERAAAGDAFPDRLLEARPAVAPGCRMRLSHVPGHGEWMVEDCVLATAWPFPVEARCPPWTASFLTRCDGHRTVEEHLAWLKSEGLVPPETPGRDLAALVRSLLAGGLLEVAEFPLPGG